MTEYLIAFNAEWVPDLTDEELREASKRVSALRAEMEAAGVLIFTGGLDDAAPVFAVDASSGTPLVTDGPYGRTRNPMYLGHLLFVVGLAAATCSPLAVLLGARQLARFRERVRVDEGRLERIFGDEYRAYRQRVPRWLPGAAD